MVHSEKLTYALGPISKTYRPLAQAVTWLGFLLLGPSIFPTSVFRQTVLQLLIYFLFVLAWWIVYATVPQRRLFALVACVAGGVFFSGYVQTFHIYGIFYVPVVLTLAVALCFHNSRALGKQEVWFAIVAAGLALWHPFATALFLGFYCGFYVNTFWQRTNTQHARAILILVGCTMVVVAVVFVFPTRTEIIPFHTRLLGFLVSYHTNEVNVIASIISVVLAQLAVLSLRLSSKSKVAAVVGVATLSILFLLKGLPLLLLWICVVLVKLFRLRSWSLLFLELTATLLPFGGGIGTPIYGLFAIMVAVYATPLGWVEAEKSLSVIKARHVIGAVTASVILLLMVRAGIDVPILAKAASPLLTERERTYQLERILAWLHRSDYCGYEVVFAENAGSPIDSIENIVTRRNRPPAGLEDVQVFWDSVLRCRKGEQAYDKTGKAIVTFAGPAVADAKPVLGVKGRYAGDATVWIGISR
jgi:hypothetical protein